MAAVALNTGVKLSPVNDYQYISRTLIANVDLVSGVVVTLDATTGKAVKAAGTGAQYGVVLQNASAGDPVTVMIKGVVAGWNVSALNYGASVYAGAAGVVDTAGTVAIGKVVPMSEIGSAKVVEINL